MKDGNSIGDEQLEEMRKAQQIELVEKRKEELAQMDKEQEETPKDKVIDIEKNERLMAEIQKLFKVASVENKMELKEMLSSLGASKFDVENMETSVFEKSIEILSK